MPRIAPSLSITALAIGVLVLAQQPLALSRPHVGVLVVAAAAAALHAVECFAETRSGAAVGFFFWGMTPYGLCLLISSLSTVRVAPVAGGVPAGTIVAWLIARRSRQASGPSTPGRRQA